MPPSTPFRSARRPPLAPINLPGIQSFEDEEEEHVKYPECRDMSGKGNVNLLLSVLSQYGDISV